jgi:hypothetical protein
LGTVEARRMSVKVLRLVLGCAAAIALLGGCAAGGIAPAAIANVSAFSNDRAVRDQAANDAELYVSQFKATSIAGYAAPDRKNRGPVCTVPGLRQVNGIGVDPNGTVWIPQQNSPTGPEIIASFGRHCGPHGVVLSDPSGFPFGIAFDSHGTKYVQNVQDFGSKPGEIVVYAHGATTPTASLSDPAFTLLNAVGVDRNDNVYAMYVTRDQTAAITEFAKGRMPGKPLRGFKMPGVPGGTLLFDAHRRLVVNDLSTRTVSIFAPPYDGNPQRIRLHGTSWQCALNPGQTRLACADYENGVIDVYAYPSGEFLYDVSTGLLAVQTVVGVAYDPAAR